MSNLPLVCIVILNYDGAQLTIDCLDSVLKIGYANFKAIVVDNGSTDDSVARLKSTLADPRLELLVNDKNEGYAGGNNRGIEKALSKGAEYVFVLNNDTIADPGCLDSLVTAFEVDPRIAIGACRIEDVGDESEPNHGQKISLFTGKTLHWHHDQPVTGPADVDFVCGAAIMLRAKVLREIGAFDSHLFLYYEDADICFRARKAGHSVCFVPGRGVRHLVGATTKTARARALVCYCLHRNRIWFIRRHGSLKHRIVFALLTFCYRYPRVLLGHVVRREFDLLWPLLKAVWSGYRPYSGCAGPFRVRGVVLSPLQGQSECES